MNTVILEHNGELARSWAKEVNEKLQGNAKNFDSASYNIATILDWFENCKTVQAERRDVIHQSLGRVSYFSIPMLTMGGNFAYLRGYLAHSDDNNGETIIELVESSSNEFKSLEQDPGTLGLLLSTLPKFVKLMATNLHGQKHVKSHYDLDDDQSVISQISENDWLALRQILMSTNKSDDLSPEFLDLFDLHAKTPNINQ
jgi:hypothetical protein